MSWLYCEQSQAPYKSDTCMCPAVHNVIDEGYMYNGDHISSFYAWFLTLDTCPAKNNDKWPPTPKRGYISISSWSTGCNFERWVLSFKFKCYLTGAALYTTITDLWCFKTSIALVVSYSCHVKSLINYYQVSRVLVHKSWPFLTSFLFHMTYTKRVYWKQIVL